VVSCATAPDGPADVGNAPGRTTALGGIARGERSAREVSELSPPELAALIRKSLTARRARLLAHSPGSYTGSLRAGTVPPRTGRSGSSFVWSLLGREYMRAWDKGANPASESIAQHVSESPQPNAPYCFDRPEPDPGPSSAWPFVLFLTLTDPPSFEPPFSVPQRRRDM